MARSSNLVVTRGGHHHRQAPAGEAGIYPGMGLSFTSAGAVVKQAATKAEALKSVEMVAREDLLVGASLDTVYASGSEVRFYIPAPGDGVNLLIKDGETIAIGDKIVPEGGGTGLYIEAAGTEASYAYVAEEAVSPSGANGHCKCMRV